jgi:hypothetical protein
VESWDFPSSWFELWESLNPATKDRIVNAYAEYAKVNRASELVYPIAQKLHTREQTVLRWPVQKLVTHVRGLCDSDTTTVLAVLVVYFEHSRRNLRDEWDALLDEDERDEQGVFVVEELEACIAELLRDNTLDDVRLFTQFLHLIEKDAWVHISEVDFATIETTRLAVEDEERDEEEEERDQHPDTITPELLTTQLESVRKAFADASAVLTAVSEKLAAGILPAPDERWLPVDLRKSFVQLKRVVAKQMADLGLPGFAEAPTSLAALESAIAQITRATMLQDEARKQVDAALQALDIVLSLRVLDGQDMPALSLCQRGAADLGARIEKIDSLVQDDEINAELKVYKTVASMLNADTLPGDQDLQQVAALFGLGFVWALARGQVAPAGSGSEAVESASDVSRKLPSRPDDPALSPPLSNSEFLPPPEAAPASQEEPAVSGSGAAGLSEEFTSLSASANGSHSEEETAGPVPSHPTSSSPESESHASSRATDDIQEPTTGSAERTPDGAEEDIPPASAGFDVREGETSAALASALLSEAQPAPEMLQRLVWLALGEQKTSAAYHLATCIRGEDFPSSDLFPVYIRAAILGQAIRNPLGPISDQLKVEYPRLTNWSDSEELGLALRLLMIASALRPAVLAPDINAKALLEVGAQSLPRLDRLYWLCNQLAEYANLRLPLDAVALAFIDTSVNLAERMASFQSEVRTWWDRAPHLNFKYAPAAKVWKSWLEADSPVGKLILPILDNNRERFKEVTGLIEQLDTEAKIRTAINAEAKRHRGYGFSGTINWNALSVFTRHVRDAVGLATRWVAFQEIRPADQLDYRRKRLLELRNKLDSARADIDAELSQAIAAAKDIRVSIALQVCHRACDNLLSLMHPKGGEGAVEPPVKYLLSSDLLLVPGLPLNDEWEPRLSSDQLVRLLLTLLSSRPTPNWDDALSLVNEDRRDHESVDRIREYLSWEGHHDDLVQRLTSLQETHLKQCQGALVRQIEACTRQVERGVSLGLVRDHERADYLERIHGISHRLDSVRNFEAEEDELVSIVAAIETSRMHQVEQVRARMESEGIGKDAPSYARIHAALERGDVDTANESIDLTLRGDTLPELSEAQDWFREFFPTAATEIDAYLSDPQRCAELPSAIESRQTLPGVDLREIPDPQIEEAVAVIEAWNALKKVKRPKPEHIRTLFERLGFSVLRLTEAGVAPRASLSMEFVALKHRNQCPVPYFGSLANGHYRVLCIWDRPSEEEVLNAVRHGRQGSPTIVLYFGRLSEQRRRSLAQLSRADNLNFILIDELLITYLCGERGSRLPVMFDCALPFTFVNPYTTTSSNVPPEMFYGRRWEREQIIDPMGSCFVYGGRQLGKTALLLSIRDEFHNPAEQRVALWIDLRSYAEDIWIVLSRAFKDLPDVDLEIGDARSEQKLIDKLQAWLAANKQRRILLLLDEADRFLESDSEDMFRRTSTLKGLMERTNRSFKVVFAGLHNVQRTTKQQNHPLAHFGEPICVGPLLDRGEWKEAKALIERPFWSMGFRFDSPDLVTRILSRTNYYPSLIQLYCNQIYQSIKGDQACLRNGPPYIITSRHVEDAYSSRQFENAIREKFELTLNLDPRYRVLALIIALNSLQGAAHLMSVNDIRVQAFNWWAMGFSESRTEEDFRVLLEEMLGLGILREVNGNFALRTPNLLSLLGRHDQIEQKLLQSSYDAPPPPYASHVHRTSHRKQTWRRNPLPDQQDSEIRADQNSVSIIFGSKAAGLDDVEPFLAQSSDPSHLATCDLPGSDRHVFRKYLEDVRARAQNGTTIVVVRQSPWTIPWVHEALSLPKGRTRFTSVVFVADPETTWRLASERTALDPLLTARKVNAISLQPWHTSVLWQWLGDCGIGSNAIDEQKEIGAGTGRWPLILEEFRNAFVSGQPWKAALSQICLRLHDPVNRPAYLEAFGLNVSTPRIVLAEMAGLGGKVLPNDLAELLDPIPKTQIADTFYWADRLGLIQPAAGGEWVIDPIVGVILVGETTQNGLVDAPGPA